MTEIKPMRLLLNIPRRNLARRLWEEQMLVDALVSGTPTYFIASSRAQAEKTFEVTTALLNGCDPKGTAPG